MIICEQTKRYTSHPITRHCLQLADSELKDSDDDLLR